jgi:hypothetical protein
MRTIIIGAIAVLTIAGCAPVDDAKTGTAVPPPAASNGSTSKPSSSGAHAKYTGTCDTDLGSGSGNDYSLTSEVEVKNTGDVDVKVAVLVSWPQYGHGPVGDGKVITLKAGKSATVELNKHVNMAQFGRAQDYQLKHGGELKCKYKVIVNPVS